MKNASKYLAIVLAISCAATFAQPEIVKKDSVISSMVREVSSSNLESNIRKLVSFGTRHSLSQRKSETTGIGAACNWVKSEFDKYAESSNGRLTAVLDSFVVEPDGRRIIRKVLMTNVMTTLKGSDPNDNRIFIVSGHLDSRASEANDSVSAAPGADDDGSGVAAVLELARVMSKHSFPATIIFVAVSGEEQGLFGSTHLAKKAKDQNWNVVAMLNNDMIGNSYSGQTFLKDNIDVRVFSEGVPLFETDRMKSIRQSTNAENDGISRQLARYVREISERYVDQLNVKLVYRNDRFLRGGDHTPFNRQGFAAVRFCEMNEEYNHQHQNVSKENGIQYGDLPEFVDYEYARKITCANLATLANLSMAPAVPQKVGVLVKELTNETTLKWNSPEGRAPKGYYVMMRETDQPVWQKKFYTEDTKITLPYSKDNFFFAVQSVDDSGHESLPVWPVPVR